jgi:uncharacterized membrane protein
MGELFLIFVLFSFLGWSIEVIYAYYKHHKFVNRGFLAGPFCPIYGIGVVILYVTIHTILNQSSMRKSGLIIATFILSALVTTIIEWIVGALLYYFFKTRWWDYSHQKLNFKGYICLKFSIYWGVIGTVVIYSVLPLSFFIIGSLSEPFMEALITLFLIYFVIDGSLTMRTLVDFRRLLFELENEAKNMRQSQLKLINEMRDSFDLFKKYIEKLDALQSYYSFEIKEIINDLIDHDKIISVRTKFNMLNNQKNYEQLVKKIRYSRLFKAFPDMTSRRFSELLKDLRRR